MDFRKTCTLCLVILLCFIFFFTAPIVILSLSLVTHNPKLYIEDLYVPALINTPNSESNFTRLNTFIFIDLKLENVMPFNGIRYGDVNLTFFYGGNRTSVPVANYTLPGFYQGHKKTAHRRQVLRTRGLPWDDAFLLVSDGSKVVFGVELATTVKLQRCGVYTKRKALVVGGDVEVDASGELVNHKVVRLN